MSSAIESPSASKTYSPPDGSRKHLLANLRSTGSGCDAVLLQSKLQRGFKRNDLNVPYPFQDVKSVRWHPSGEVLVSSSYDDSIKLWVDAHDEWVCAQTLAGNAPVEANIAYSTFLFSGSLI